MDNNMITRAQHDEFARRMDDTNRRHEKRLELLESSVQQISSIAINVEKLANNMQQMCKEQKQQGERLQTLEGRDGEKWRTVASCALTAVVTILISYVASKIGLAG